MEPSRKGDFDGSAHLGSAPSILFIVPLGMPPSPALVPLPPLRPSVPPSPLLLMFNFCLRLSADFLPTESTHEGKRQMELANSVT